MARLIIALYSVLFTLSVVAETYDAPLKFNKYLTDDGRVIYSNIPKKCFSNGLLKCGNLHPIYGVPSAPKKAASSSVKKASSTQSKQRASTTNASTTGWQCNAKLTCGEIESCAEAQFYLNICDQSDLDSNDDGVPCEEICK